MGGPTPIPRYGWKREGGGVSSSSTQPLSYRSSEEVIGKIWRKHMKDNIDENDDEKTRRAEPFLQVIAP